MKDLAEKNAEVLVVDRSVGVVWSDQGGVTFDCLFAVTVTRLLRLARHEPAIQESIEVVENVA